MQKDATLQFLHKIDAKLLQLKDLLQVADSIRQSHTPAKPVRDELENRAIDAWNALDKAIRLDLSGEYAPPMIRLVIAAEHLEAAAKDLREHISAEAAEAADVEELDPLK